EEGTFIVDDMGAFANVTFKANHTNSEESVINGYSQHDMIYEVKSFINIINENDQENYKKLKEISATVLEVTEKVRKENDIIYTDRKSTRLNSSHVSISYAVFCLKKKNNINKKSKVREEHITSE